jgi:Tol biopolymer transport system component
MLTALLLVLQACGGGGGDANLQGPGTPAGSTPPPPAGGAQRIDPGALGTVSRDGSTIVYLGATEHTAGMPANVGASANVFLYRIATGARTLVSVDPAGTAAGNFSSSAAKLSADGRYVVFASQASNLMPTIIYSAPAPGFPPNTQIFARDLATGRTQLVSIDPSGFAAGNDEAYQVFFVSSDARYVTFASKATNLVAGVSYAPGYNVFVRDLVAAKTEFISVAPDGVTAACCGWNNDSFPLAISDDGRYVAFISDSTNLVTGVTYAPVTADVDNVYLRDRITGSTRLLSISPDGRDAANWDCMPTSSMSHDGATVVFSCNATNLVAGPAYATDMLGIPHHNVFLWHRANPSSLTLVTRSFDGASGANQFAASPVISADGRFVAFSSAASNLVAGVDYLTPGGAVGGPSSSNVFRWDRQTGTMQLVTRRPDGATGADFDTGVPQISDTGHVVAFFSEATNLMPIPAGVPPERFRNNVVFWNATTNVIALASVAAFGGPMGFALPVFALAGTGDVIAFNVGFQGGVYLFKR